MKRERAYSEDASGVYGMSTLLKFLFANGAGAVKAVAVGKDERVKRRTTRARLRRSLMRKMSA